MPQKVEQVQVDHSYFGYVSSIMPFGVFVSFLDTLQALVPLRALSPRFVKDAKDVVRLGQAVRVTCTEIKEGKVEGSLLGASDAETEALYMLSLEEEQLRLMDLGKTMDLEVSDDEEEEENEEEEEEENEEEENGELEANNASDKEDESENESESESENDEEKQNEEHESENEAMEEEEAQDAQDAQDAKDESESESEDEAQPFDWKACPLGTVCPGHIKTVRDYGVIVEMDNGFLGFAPSPLHTENVSLQEGVAVTARVLDVNVSLQLYDVTLSQRFLPDSAPPAASTPASPLTVGASLRGTLVVQKPDYAVLALDTPAKPLVLAALTSFNSPKQPFSGLSLGDAVDCSLLCAPGVGPAICDLRNAFKDALSAADSAQIDAFFAAVGVADLATRASAKPASTKPRAARAQTLEPELLGKKVVVTVLEARPSELRVALPAALASRAASAAIWAVDVDGKKEGGWPAGIAPGVSLEAKCGCAARLTRRIVARVPSDEFAASSESHGSTLLLSLRSADLSLPEVASRRGAEA